MASTLIATVSVIERDATPDANRIIACVNALEGIDDPAAARALIDDPRTAAITDMHQALKDIYQELLNYPSVGKLPAYLVAQIRDAIAKAEGRE